MISAKAFNHLWSQYEGRVLICNLVSQMEAAVLSKVVVQEILQHFDRDDMSADEIWGVIQGHHDAGTMNIRFASSLAPTKDNMKGLIRVAPMGAILDNVDKVTSSEVRLIESRMSRFASRINSKPKDTKFLDDCEEELHQLFEEAAVDQHRSGIPTFTHGDLSWINVALKSNIKLSSLKAGNPAFCTTSSLKCREGEIFKNRGGSADRARDILGLAPFDNTYRRSVVAFGAMAFDIEDLEGAPRFARPSVADMVDSKRFKGVFGELSGKTDVWGRAVDLAKIGQARPHRGGREVVVEASRPRSLHVAFLGYVRLPRGDVYSDAKFDQGFEILCMRGRKKDDFMKILCS